MTLAVRDLRVSRGGREVLHDVTLDVPPGQITALLGANGAGKSTLVLTVAGLLPVTAGSITAGDDRLTGLRPERVRRLGVAAVPEGHRVLRSLTVADNLRVAGPDATPALEAFPELRDLSDRLAGALSGGQQQMLALAQAMVGGPRYLLVDELSFGLAPAVVGRLVPALVALAERGAGVLLIEQYTRLALELAERVHVLDRGHITMHGTPDEVRGRLHSAYLGEGNGG
ncbi:ATP-binding cassette domain-containing protein [Spongiactinospora sp. TRM90649]|uniref:ABC transporter ATP-binding protein n=1 Tax=Spongiactinospora sp. TRM90649 TaxID=3031114 RepID=UPI0023F74CDE|nr:ATP-binding cassette domain-containing protein [Spongiactinospora sp. TRM90649]MDF5756284.1 ATP-binding cassette domain-containing protein [Spongiactinospora sp. TRM90649]